MYQFVIPLKRFPEAVGDPYSRISESHILYTRVVVPYFYTSNQSLIDNLYPLGAAALTVSKTLHPMQTMYGGESRLMSAESDAGKCMAIEAGFLWLSVKHYSHVLNFRWETRWKCHQATKARKWSYFLMSFPGTWQANRHCHLPWPTFIFLSSWFCACA